MKLLLATGVVCSAGAAASAGGLLLPGAGAISTSRAGASVAATDDAEAMTLNPAGLAQAEGGTFIQIGVAAIDYAMSFHRNGTYDSVMGDPLPYAGTRYPTVTNTSKPSLGIGSFQPVPVVAIVSDLGNKVPGLTVAIGVSAPNAYPFRDMNNVNGQSFFTPNSSGGYDFPASLASAPPPTRYDILHEEAKIVLPSIAAAYKAIPGKLDVGARFSAGVASLKSSVAVWGLPANYQEYIKQDTVISLDASGFIYDWQLGASYHATPNIDLAATYTAPISIHATGDATSTNGPAVTLSGSPVVITPYDNGCQGGGTAQKLHACVDLEVPMTAQIGGRYKVLDEAGKLKADLEVDLGWEHWGASCNYATDPTCLDPSDFHVTVDAQVGTVANPSGLPLKQQYIEHGFQDTYSVRAGGSWQFPVGNDQVIARGGIGYDTAAAKPGWERADIDGAARTMLAAGASYKMKQVQLDAGFAVILEGTRGDARTCDPTASMEGCAGTPGYSGGTPGQDNPVGQRKGPDPINPIVIPAVQAESPVNEGTFKSHYLLMMLGASYHF
jgi:long-subunit fatty acid transport protein